MASALKFQIPDLTNYLVVTWVENDNPLVEIGRQSYPPGTATGQASGVNLLVPAGLNSTVYLFRFYDSIDGIETTSLVDSWDLDASITDAIAERYEYQVDRGLSGTNPNWSDPVSGSDTLSDERLAGADYNSLQVEFRGIGQRSQSEYTIQSSGGITLTSVDDLGTAEKFVPDQWVFIVYYRRIAQNTVNSPNPVSDIKVVTSDLTLDASYLNCLVSCELSANNGTITLPPFNSLTSLKKLTFITHNSTRYVRVQFSNSDSVKFRGNIANHIDLLAGETLEMIFKTGQGYVTHCDQAKNIGSLVLVSKSDQYGTHLADGSESQINDFLRVIESLKPEQICSYADRLVSVNIQVGKVTKLYYPNIAKFAVDFAAGTFKWPDMRGFYLKTLNNYTGAVDTLRLSQGANGVQPQNLIDHIDLITIGQNGTSHVRTRLVPGNTDSTGMDYGDGETKGIKPTTYSNQGKAQEVDNIAQYGAVII
jgi:hypothetical protein